MKPLELLRYDLSNYKLEVMSIEFDSWIGPPYCRVLLRYTGYLEDFEQMEKARRKALRVKPVMIDDFVFDRKESRVIGETLPIFHILWYYKVDRRKRTSQEGLQRP